jgi:dolichol-phosphate mannosyltransferase
LNPRVSIVIPVYNEGENVLPVFERILDTVTIPFEVLVVYDQEEDTTAPVAQQFGDERFRGVLNTIGPGPARAIRAGMAAAKADVVVVTMADGSDDISLVDSMTRLVERGCAVAAASRYMSGGAQVGGPFLKGLMSKTAGRVLYWFARVDTHDATNSFKAYDRRFIEEVGVDSDGGFEIGIELVAKARRLRRPSGSTAPSASPGSTCGRGSPATSTGSSSPSAPA